MSNYMRKSVCTILSIVALALLMPVLAHAQTNVLAVTNRTSYDVGSEVMMPARLPT